ncbi:MAG: ATP synthase F1 subunit gamma [Candidatus Magasanikbacteria bacterium]|nr:ATP synthase F1 subunit gamma [Candidatus Magasanikbacteria bacterium]NCS72268.1 ATP synthase F1 subunit gamma [Candidatus Magasanikbacteria bacterium]
MPVNAKAIKARINASKNTKKITKAMELVSAAKMKKAVEATENTRLYGRLVNELLQRLAFLDEQNYSLLELRPVKKVLAIMVSSNRGLCGGYNANVFKTAYAELADAKNITRLRIDQEKEPPEPTNEVPHITILGIGKKSASFAKRYGYELEAVFNDLSERPAYEDIRVIANMAIEGYKEKKYDKIIVVYTHYKTSLEQQVKIRQVLPISPFDFHKMEQDVPEKYVPHADVEKTNLQQYLFEPNLEEIIETTLPKLVHAQIYQAVLESAASEHSARMIAMKSATDNAGELIEDLTREYNKARQAAITQEIAEIAGGAAALS